MDADKRFAEALDRMDAANREDPRTETVDGWAQPRELLFAQRVYDWVKRLVDIPSDALLLAARGHTLRRWMIPRDRYPKTTAGYHQWRSALADYHADQAEAILREVGYSAEMLQAVRAFITRANWPASSEACALEDADCLVFLETKLADYLNEWDEAKTLRILERTIRKMTPQARQLATQLKLSNREMELLGRAAQSHQA